MLSVPPELTSAFSLFPLRNTAVGVASYYGITTPNTTLQRITVEGPVSLDTARSLLARYSSTSCYCSNPAVSGSAFISSDVDFTGICTWYIGELSRVRFSLGYRGVFESDVAVHGVVMFLC